MYCKNCGRVISDLDLECPYCGEKVEQDSSDALNGTVDNVSCIDNGISRNRSLIIIASYFGMQLLVATVLSLIIQSIYIAVNNTDIRMITETDPIFNQRVYDEFETVVSLWVNVILDVGLLVLMFFLAKRYLIDDIRHSLKNKKKTLKAIGIGFAIFFGGNLLSGFLLSFIFTVIQLLKIIPKELVEDAANQELITNMIKYNFLGTITMGFAVIVCAPIIEEIVFRKAFFGILPKNKLSSAFISGLVFGLIHVVTSVINIITQMATGVDGVGFQDIIVQSLYLITYFTSGFLLSLIYQKSNHNIVVVIVIHMINNLISVIQIILLDFINQMIAYLESMS